MRDKEHPDRGHLYDRTEFSRLELSFAEAWERHNRPHPGTNFGNGILQDLFLDHFCCHHRITPNERYVAATVVQWLGSNVGFSFMQGCLNACGYLIHGSEPRNPNQEAVLQEIALALASADARQMLFDLCEPH